jgi:hypothetical protein
VSQITLDEAYDTAFAVYSPRVTFVEWTMLEVQSENDGAWWPYADYTGGRLFRTWQGIEGERWIYVFQEGLGAGSVTLVEELFLAGDGQIHATDMDKLKAQRKAHGSWPEPAARGASIPIGKTICFLRQFWGQPLTHYFFSSRTRLPGKLIAHLENTVAKWKLGVTFTPTDRNMFPASNGNDAFVPVLDPITVAMHLSAYFVAASNDHIRYLTPVDDPDNPHSTAENKDTQDRQKKFLLAQLVGSLLDADDQLNAAARSDVHYDFLHDYEEQVQYRKQWRSRWARYLTNWLRAGPIQVVTDAYQLTASVPEFLQFLLWMAQCHFRLSESPEGRKLLQEHFELEKFSWVQRYVLGRGEISDDKVQAVRKLGLAPVEFLKEHVPVWMSVGKRSLADEIAAALKKLQGADWKPTPIYFGRRRLGYMAWIPKGEGGELITAETPAELYAKSYDQEELVALVDEIHEHDAQLKAPWKGAIGSLVAGIELINFALAVRAFEKVPAGERKEKIWAFVELAGAGIDLSTAGLALFGKASEKTLAKLCFVSAVIDTVVNAHETLDALSEGKFGKALGTGIVTFGSAVIAVGILVDASVAGPLGLVIVGIGFIVKAIFSDPSDYETFITFSSFGVGDSSRRDEKPGWYKTDKTFDQWGNDLDEQLRAAAMLLCKFTIKPVMNIGFGLEHQPPSKPPAKWLHELEDRLRTGEIKMGWVPTGAKLHLNYSEDWTDSKNSQQFKADIEFSADQTKILPSKLRVQFKSDGIISVQAPGPAESARSIVIIDTDGFYQGLEKGLKITLTGSFDVDMAGDSFTAESGDDDGVIYPWL